MTLPPDFWTRPQPGGVAGLGIGFAVAVVLSFYLLSTARRSLGPGPMSRWQRIGVTVIIKLIVVFCMIAGAVVSSLIFLSAGRRRARCAHGDDRRERVYGIGGLRIDAGRFTRLRARKVQNLHRLTV
jgi:hypothetical protein